MLYTLEDSPIGKLLLVGDGEALHGLYMQDGRTPIKTRRDWKRRDGAFAAAREQLGEYFAGTRTTFDLPLVQNGDAFQTLVWAELQRIPYGATVSYGHVAREIARPDAARAVGPANAQNPIAVIVPCHRVIGADGSLTGYGGGLERKRLLLELEQGVLSLGSSAFPRRRAPRQTPLPL
jgi:methylated-DNA-[protein]-cysteine S-methyltransferase